MSEYYLVCPKCKSYDNLIIGDLPPWYARCNCGWSGWEQMCEKIYRQTKLSDNSDYMKANKEQKNGH